MLILKYEYFISAKPMAITYISGFFLAINEKITNILTIAEREVAKL